MRPLKIEMTALGPYKDKEVIDFSALGHHQLFVISGPTGAGKTTIFDAICFALYGTASGSDRQNVTMLRSHFADDEVHTSVQFIFRLKEKTYRILRQLGHKKAGNKTATGEKYELYEILEDGSEIPAVERQIVSEINKKLEQIIGLTEDQFKQIVMLPQGEFRKLLTSETENKEAILRRLFKTEKYKQFNHILQEKREALVQHFTEEKKMLDHYMEQITSLTEIRTGSMLEALLQQDSFHSGQVVEALIDEWKFLSEKQEKEKQAYEGIQKEHEEKTKEYNASVNVNEKFTEKENKEAALGKLLNQEAAYKQKEKTLQAANEAAKITPYEKQLQERKAELSSYEKTEKEQTSKLKTVEKQYKEAITIYEKEVALEDHREKLRREVERLESFKPIVEAMDKRKQALEKQASMLEENRVQSKKLGIKITEDEEAVEKLKGKIDQADASLREKAKLDENVQGLREKYKVVEAFQDIHTKAMNSKKKLEHARKVFAEEKAKYTSFESTWFTQQAVVLATHLHDGEACPVCGSVEHPNKATNKEEIITKEELDEKKQYIEKLDNRLREIEQGHYEYEGTWKTRKQQMDHFGLPIHQLEETKATIKQGGQQLKEALKELVKLEEERENWRKEVLKLEADLKENRMHKEKIDQTYAEENASYRANESLFTESKKEIPEEIQQLEALEVHLEKTITAKKKMEENFTLAETKKHETEKQRLTVEEALKHTAEMIKTEKEKVAQLKNTFMEQLQLASFETKEAYELAKLEENARLNLQEEIRAYAEEKNLLQHQVNELAEVLRDKEKMDTGALKDQVDTLKAEYEAAMEQLQKTKYRTERIDELRKNIEDLSIRVKAVEEELVIVEDVYDLLRGQNNRKISFERYVQIDYLDQITQAANERFRSLTNGQYYLIRSDRQETHGRQSGLALDVYDAYTGLTRDVKTLSGGEKFIASLCLALGMSDVIQSFQGSVSIETMFIDEGFGSLDDESLQKAIDALIQLQESGRMIGLISHVEELKTIFPAMLEVTKTKEGYSKTSFNIK